MGNHIKRLKTGENIELETLQVEELYKLHFEEEKYAARIIKEFQPFSKERTNYFINAYNNINRIKCELRTRNNTPCANNKESKCQIIERIAQKIKKDRITLLELGCGNGNLLKMLSRNDNFDLSGCDLQENPSINNLTIYNKTIYETLLTLNDNSIDIIVADNVCEHFLEDEADEIYNLINHKIRGEGYCIFFIPNILIGPSDISKRFLKYKEKPVGFHYMEQTYSENIRLFNRHRLKTAYLYVDIKNRKLLIRNILGIPDRFKTLLERIIDKSLSNDSKERRRHFFSKYGYTIYIEKKITTFVTKVQPFQQ
ncbi:MAG: methyltransferase domain-containing protein [Salinivirgaceae bacterium]|nr:methyltransferase domain-containing protein [Salinivirgaceae bacterium]